MKRLILSGLFFVFWVTVAFADEVPKIPGLTGINFLTDVTDINKRQGTPVTIPKKWKFVGTSGTNLWFQDDDGTIYLVLGTMQGGGFYTTGIIQRLNVKDK